MVKEKRRSHAGQLLPECALLGVRPISTLLCSESLFSVSLQRGHHSLPFTARILFSPDWPWSAFLRLGLTISFSSPLCSWFSSTANGRGLWGWIRYCHCHCDQTPNREFRRKVSFDLWFPRFRDAVLGCIMLARPMGRQNAMATEQQGVADQSSLYPNGQEAMSCPGGALYFFQRGSAS